MNGVEKEGQRRPCRNCKGKKEEAKAGPMSLKGNEKTPAGISVFVCSWPIKRRDGGGKVKKRKKNRRIELCIGAIADCDPLPFTVQIHLTLQRKCRINTLSFVDKSKFHLIIYISLIIPDGFNWYINFE
jgi:hypothetical protein